MTSYEPDSKKTYIKKVVICKSYLTIESLVTQNWVTCNNVYLLQMLARTLKESFRGNLDYHYHENRRVNLISAWLQFSLTLKNLYIVPAFFERFVDLSYDKNFQEKIYLYFLSRQSYHISNFVRLTIKDIAKQNKNSAFKFSLGIPD